jgi:hypothetical protein
MYNEIKKRKFGMMVNNSTNINKKDNHINLKLPNTKQTYGVGHPDTKLHVVQLCRGSKRHCCSAQ